MAPSKTFNIAGLSTSFIQSNNKAILHDLRKKINAMQIHMGNIFGNIALETAYNQGDEWLKQLHTYLEGNIEFVLSFFNTNLPEIKIYKPEATYLIWIDFSAWQLTQPELKEFLVTKAGVGLNDGMSFGVDGEGFMRMNIASPRSILEKALNQILRSRKSI